MRVSGRRTSKRPFAASRRARSPPATTTKTAEAMNRVSLEPDDFDPGFMMRDTPSYLKPEPPCAVSYMYFVLAFLVNTQLSFGDAIQYSINVSPSSTTHRLQVIIYRNVIQLYRIL